MSVALLAVPSVGLLISTLAFHESVNVPLGLVSCSSPRGVADDGRRALTREPDFL